MGRNFIIIQGSLHRMKFYRGAADATSVTLYMKNVETDAVQSFTENYSDGVAVVEIPPAYTAVAGTYSYQINESTPDGAIKYRTGDCSGDDCVYGIITICESLDGVVS